jgi:hypothetical protein
MRIDQRQQGRASEITSWRCRQLASSGFPGTLARRIAQDASYDLHALIELIERGCPPELAVRILAPLDEEPLV